MIRAGLCLPLFVNLELSPCFVMGFIIGLYLEYNIGVIMRISYILTSFRAFVSESIVGFASDAKAEIDIISKWSLPEVWHLHNWTRV